MTARSRIETSIAAELTRLSDEDMQRVAEDYARIRYPDRFPRFDFRAFSPEGKSRWGWPDAWVDLGDGQLDGVEATNTKDRSGVRRHLEDYLAKAREREPKLSGFIHVSGNPAVQLSDEDVTRWLNRFVDEAGIAPDRLDLVFGGGLVEVLARPEFARTRIEILNMSDSPAHFKLVRARQGPDEGRLHSAFVPSHDDYTAGHVYRPEAADQVIGRLARNGCALVRGVGASGKSVLAWLLSLESADRRFPAYTLDLADYAEADPGLGSELSDDLHRFGHPEVLFVLDNCHLDESLAKEIFLAWDGLATSQRPRLLLVGRETQTSRGSLIDGLGVEPLTLKARQPELRGVYRRLAWRQSVDGQFPEPPEDVLNEWVAEFGGDPHSPQSTTDLIAFSAAAQRRMESLLRRHWPLHASDAIEEIREVYLRDLSKGETSNLMRLCVLEELEIALPDDALSDRRAGIEDCSRRHGLVFRQTAGPSGQYVRYRLAHAALGRLILSAAFDPVDPMAERKRIALQSANAGALTVGRLAANERVHEARDLLSEMLPRLELAEVLEVRAPDPGRPTIGVLQLQLWYGLREMANVQAHPTSVPPHLADRNFLLWEAMLQDENADDLPQHIRDSSTEMIAWLRACKAAGWRLVPPQESSDLRDRQIRP